MWIVYIIQHSNTKQIYIGRTNNLRCRLAEHNANRQDATKRKNGIWIVVYAEAYRDKKDADEREQRLKDHGRAKQELKKRIKNSLL